MSNKIDKWISDFDQVIRTEAYDSLQEMFASSRCLHQIQEQASVSSATFHAAPAAVAVQLDANGIAPCPLCGSESKHVKADVGGHRILCWNDDCECSSGYFCSKEEAITSWNTRAALAATPAAVPTYIEVRECSECGHIGINDADGSKAACSKCDWQGDSPVEDKCPDCNTVGTMTAACSKCGARASLLAETTLHAEPIAPAAVAPVALPEPDDYKQEIDSENCMQCSVAYLLGLPLHMVPDFAAQETSQLCWELFESFISSQGYAAVMLTGIYEFETDYLASGTSPRGIPHMVVMNDGNLVHDPHPSNAGISDVQCIWLITRRALLAGVSAPAALAVERGEVLVTVSGFTGSGKSAIAGEIEIMCRALGLQVEWPDSDSEKHMTHADWTAALEQYKPRVRIVEQNIPFASKKGLSE